MDDANKLKSGRADKNYECKMTVTDGSLNGRMQHLTIEQKRLQKTNKIQYHRYLKK
jgi:hypothetical protein